MKMKPVRWFCRDFDAVEFAILLIVAFLIAFTLMIGAL